MNHDETPCSETLEATPVTIAEFRASRREVADLGPILREETLNGIPGYVYMDTLYISKWPEQGRLHLLIERDEWLYADTPTALAEMEQTLFNYADGEHFNFR
jgi:hypothetical protein